MSNIGRRFFLFYANPYRGRSEGKRLYVSPGGFSRFCYHGGGGRGELRGARLRRVGEPFQIDLSGEIGYVLLDTKNSIGILNQTAVYA